MASRDPADLHPALREAWEWLKPEFQRRYPTAPEPRLSCTYRGKDEQEAAFHAGKSRARYGESLHNFRPAFAFDVFFQTREGTADWSFGNFERFGQLAKSIGLVWGGDWPGLVDGPHVQLDMSAALARAGVVPPEARPRIPTESPLLPVDSLYVYRAGRASPLVFALDSERPARVVGRKLYVNTRAE